MFEEYYILMLLLTFGGGFLIYLVISVMVKSPGRALQSKFAGIGVLKGKTKEDIIAAVGPPNGISSAPNGGQVLQWMATGYHIVLLFDSNGICQGITHEFAS
jgi:hypothetical protein